MHRLSSLAARLAIVGLFLSILVLVPAMACTGPAGPAGPAGAAGAAGPAGPAAPAGSIPVVVASPTSVAIAADDTVNLGAVTFIGAGWGTETGIYIEMLLPGGTWQMLTAAMPTNGAFTIKPSVTNTFKVAAGSYTVRATGKNTGNVAFVPFTINPKPPPATPKP